MTHQKLALTLVGLMLGLFTASAAHTETITKHGLFCRHLETLHQFPRVPNCFVEFYTEQFKKGECAFAGLPFESLKIGTVVRIEKRSGDNICVAPVGSTQPCLWTDPDIFAE